MHTERLMLQNSLIFYIFFLQNYGYQIRTTTIKYSVKNKRHVPLS